ncbi:MAG TPA: hypothetical protein VFS32_05195 [Candidatus Limnocylindrales bacterium]|nr:hypothetical protein [Candidatus Limnocylindrales bacterium]
MPKLLPPALARLLAASAVANAAAAGLTLLVPDVLTGPAVMNGSARGTSLVMLVAGVPLVATGAWLAARGWWRGLVVALGGLAYFAYNDVMLLFATPFNRLFLVYVIAGSTTLFAIVAAFRTVDPRVVADRVPRLPARAIGAYAMTIVALNTLIWLRTVVPATFAERPGSFLDGAGIATNPVFVQDLVFWLPGAAAMAVMLWRRQPLGILLGGTWLVYGLLESVGVATDQWFGTTADPTSSQASMEAVALFVVLAVVGLVPLWFFFRPDRLAATQRDGRAGAERSGALAG